MYFFTMFCRDFVDQSGLTEWTMEKLKKKWHNHLFTMKKEGLLESSSNSNNTTASTSTNIESFSSPTKTEPDESYPDEDPYNESRY